MTTFIQEEFMLEIFVLYLFGSCFFVACLLELLQKIRAFAASILLNSWHKKPKKVSFNGVCPITGPGHKQRTN